MAFAESLIHPVWTDILAYVNASSEKISLHLDREVVRLNYAVNLMLIAFPEKCFVALLKSLPSLLLFTLSKDRSRHVAAPN